jgi:hypothetical protein
MRILFVFLLILNLLFAGWIYTQPALQPARIPSLPAGLKTIELLNSKEAPAHLATNGDTPQAPEKAVNEPIVAVAPECFTLGPFNDEAAVQELKNRLSEQVRALKIRRRQEQEPHRYWVLLPSPGSRQKATELGKELVANKIKDYYIVLKGENKNALSLGHFKEKRHADRRINQLSKLGYVGDMKVIHRQYNLYWLDYRVDASKADNLALIQDYLVEGVANLHRECPL